MITRFFLVDDGKLLAILESDPEQVAEILKQKPLFEITGKNGGYSTLTEAERERQSRFRLHSKSGPTRLAKWF
jgi:hypothetical protein